jgi:hypothetical protein
VASIRDTALLKLDSHVTEHIVTSRVSLLRPSYSFSPQEYGPMTCIIEFYAMCAA